MLFSVTDGMNTKMQGLKPGTLQYLQNIQYIKLGGEYFWRFPSNWFQTKNDSFYIYHI